MSNEVYYWFSFRLTGNNKLTADLKEKIKKILDLNGIEADFGKAKLKNGSTKVAIEQIRTKRNELPKKNKFEGVKDEYSLKDIHIVYRDVDDPSGDMKELY